jgi:AcrR family transcriptional regulator
LTNGVRDGYGTLVPPTNPFDRREVLSRRGGPVKEPLSCDRIVTEALSLMSKDGLDAMSLRKVAMALDTGPASLYPYVGDLRGLWALVLDRALESVDTTGGRRRGWKERLMALLRSYLMVLLSQPGLARIAISGPAIGPNTMRIIDAVLALLDEGGFDRATAAWAVDLLLLYVTGIAAEQSHGHDPTGHGSPIAEAITRASATEYPHLSAARGDLLGGDGADRFSWAVDVLLRGMRQTRPAGARRGGARSRTR